MLGSGGRWRRCEPATIFNMNIKQDETDRTVVVVEREVETWILIRLKNLRAKAYEAESGRDLKAEAGRRAGVRSTAGEVQIYYQSC